MSIEALPEETLEDASAWHERLHRDVVSEDTKCAFSAWLAQSVDHRTAYEAAEKTWTLLQSAASDPQILALRHETALRLIRRASSARNPVRRAAAAVVLIVLCGTAAALGGWVHFDRYVASWFPESLHEGAAHRYVTAVGERLSVTLDDGSQVTLDTQSELRVAFTPSERLVRLLRGQVYLKVAKNRERPFVVDVLSRRIVAVGTAFDVRMDGAQIRIAMTEGTVRVEHRGESAEAANIARSMPSPVVTISAGEQLIADAAHPDRVSISDSERSTSWLRGLVVFDNTQLADAIGEINRYSNTKIELAGPDIAQLHLSGVFAIGRPELFIEAVTGYFPVQVVRSGEHLVVLSAKR